MRHALVIVNTHSGARLEGGEGDQALNVLREAGIGVRRLKGPLHRQLRASLAETADLVVADGGDGTIRAVIDAHKGSGRPIGILPGGTMNLLAADYGVPADRMAAAQAIVGGATRAVDVGFLNNDLFLHAAFTGLPVRLGRHRERARGRLSVGRKLAFASHALTTWQRDQPLTAHYRTPAGEEGTVESAVFALLLGRLKGPIFPRPERATVTAGVISLYALQPESAAELARAALSVAVGALRADDPAITRIEAESLTLTSRRPRAHVMMDGEPELIKTPATVRVAPGAARILVPPEMADDAPAAEVNQNDTPMAVTAEGPHP